MSGVLAYPDHPVRRGAAALPPRRRRATPVAVPWRTRLRRPTMALGTTLALLGVALTATSFTWREHVIVQRANGKRNSSGCRRPEYPGAGAAQPRPGAQPADAPTVLEAKDDVPKSTSDGCISDFDNAGVINCTYGDPSATRTIALAGGSTPSTGSPRWTRWARSAISRS